MLLTTQYLDEADQLADRIAVIDHGTVVAEGTPDELKASARASSLQLRLADPGQAPHAREAIRAVLAVDAIPSPEGGRITAPMDEPDRVADLLVALRDRGIRLAGLSMHKPTLDQVFLAITGHEPSRRAIAKKRRRQSDDHADRAARTRDAHPGGRELPHHGGARPAEMRRTPEQFADALLQPVLFTVMFAYIFGGAIAGGVQGYLPFFIPGILVLSVITTTVMTGMQLREDIDKGVFDRFRSMPIARSAPLAGALLADTIRYAIATVMTCLTGFAIGWRPAGGIVGVILAGMLVIACSWAVSWTSR